MMPPRLLAISMLLLALISCPGKASCGESPKPTEYEVKAAYIYNFTKYVEWPSGSFQGRSKTIRVCVIGDDPFGSSLTALNGKRVGKRSVRIRRNTSLHDVRSCEILFISGSEEENLDQIMKAINGSLVLTIGDSEGFARKGVMINFYMENNKVRFEINPKAAMRAGLRISSNLLRIARIVGGP